MPGGYGTRNTPWGAGGTRAPSGSYSRSAGPARGGGSSVTQGSNQQADNINRARQDRQQAEQNWVNEFADVGVSEKVKNAYDPFKSSVTGLQSNQPYTYKTQAEIDRDRKLYQSETSMKAGVAGALGGLDYSWIYDEYGKPKGRSWDPFVKFDKDGNPIKWTDDDIYDVFMGGEFYTGGPLRGQSGDGGVGWGSGYGSYGSGGRSDYGGGSIGPAGGPIPQGNAPDIWKKPNPLQQIMINTHAGKGFQQGYARGGIVSLVE